ncbi:MAG TPA: acid phosphatase [Candidatus Fraserbacteria bacterium]|nr:acid phosphatase [Candidatus Fraserbacteria bacterium]
MFKWVWVLVLSGVLLWALVGKTVPQTRSGCVPQLAHVVVVIEENHRFDQIIGNPQAPFINGLARQGALFTEAYGVAHPSQPNYLAWWSGSTQGVRDDVVRPGHFHGANFGTRLALLGRSVLAVEEPPVVGKHAPWVSFAENGMLVRSTDLAPPETLPALSFIVPNQRDDMHSGSVARGDAWLAQHLPRWLARLGTRDLLILTFDESSFGFSNHIPMVWWGPAVRPGCYDQRVDHFNVVRTVGDALGLAPLTQAKPFFEALSCPSASA